MNRKTVIAVLMVTVLCIFALIAVRKGAGRRNVTLTGIAQWSFEESAFFPGINCSRTPFWWNENDAPIEFRNEMWRRWQDLGKPNAVKVSVRADLTSVGQYGHLGQYRREIKPLALI